MLNIGVSGNDDQVARASLVSSSTIDLNNAGMDLSNNRIGRESLAIGDVVDINLLIFHQASQIQEVFVNGQTSFVMQLGIGDRGTMDFGIQNRNLRHNRGCLLLGGWKGGSHTGVSGLLLCGIFAQWQADINRM
jgi:hypothetical protein